MTYYAHSKRIYGSKQEKAELNWLNKMFAEVLDPNTGLGELGSIDPYLKAVSNCGEVVVSEYEKHIGKGAFSEVRQALSQNKPVHCIRKNRKGFYLVAVTGVAVVDEYDWAVRYGKVLTP